MESGTPNANDNVALINLTGLQVYSGGEVRDAVIQTLMRESLPDTNDSSRRFVPRAALLEIFDAPKVKQIIRSLLPGIDSPTVDELVRYICPGQIQCSQCGHEHCTRGRVILATLIWIARQDLIPVLLDLLPWTCDNHLPFEATGQTHTATTRRRNFLQNLSPVEHELFDQVQLQLSAPFLMCLGPQDGTEVPLIRGAVTLPWTQFTTIQEPKPGNPCEVGKVYIHPAHHALSDAQQDHQDVNLFALKIFQDNAKRNTERVFRNELLVNRKTPQHDRITPLLTAFQHHQRCYLVFPWAHGGNLKDFWQRHTSVQHHMQYSAKWVISECLGLVDGLATLHGFAESGVIGHGPPTTTTTTTTSSTALLHADIKPTNILCFQIDGQETYFLKFADFGISKEIDPGSPLKAKDLRQTKTYRAPEQDVEQVVSLKSDVWCLGCLFLEFITWNLVGWEGIDSFSKKRHNELDDPEATHALGQTYEDLFFKKEVKKNYWVGRFGLQVDTAVNALPMDEETRHLARRVYSLRLKKNVRVGCRIKDTVATHIEFLRNHEGCTQKLREFLSLVQDRMLVVDVEKRADAKEIRQLMEGGSLG
ncbi:hypothetical protein N0V93_008758 [Gnomoniopsis smithogilvyi]|uniref:Protein kinase domain-containing protein n=1 Tax=Gnomoniopsis smithogilvyi TaxID=1191159 RepID=A0A9W8YQV6_9PEZI|nr:hypothetical protein N0V93_008758 [Gnomoniopsis smithogilvyi]